MTKSQIRTIIRTFKFNLPVEYKIAGITNRFEVFKTQGGYGDRYTFEYKGKYAGKDIIYIDFPPEVNYSNCPTEYVVLAIAYARLCDVHPLLVFSYHDIRHSFVEFNKGLRPPGFTEQQYAFVSHFNYLCIPFMEGWVEMLIKKYQQKYHHSKSILDDFKQANENIPSDKRLSQEAAISYLTKFAKAAACGRLTKNELKKVSVMAVLRDFLPVESVNWGALLPILSEAMLAEPNIAAYLKVARCISPGFPLSIDENGLFTLSP